MDETPKFEPAMMAFMIPATKHFRVSKESLLRKYRDQLCGAVSAASPEDWCYTSALVAKWAKRNDAACRTRQSRLFPQIINHVALSFT